MLLVGRSQDLLKGGYLPGKEAVDGPIGGADTETGIQISAAQIEINGDNRTILFSELLRPPLGRLERITYE